MPRYRVTTNVTHVNGWQQWYVKAKNRDEAMELFKSGDGEFIDQEIEVMHGEVDSIELDEEVLS